ncbi:Uncharacterised protein [Vibrio cholerae]|nr:Uncharacterised protein [Vibrio cholerae]
MFDLDADLISIEATSFSQSRNWTIELVSLHAGG